MVTPEQLQFLFRFNQWANRRMLDACSPLTNDQFVRNLGSSYGSVRDTVAHIYGAEWAWNERFQGRSPASLPDASAYSDLASVRAALEDIDSHYVDFVSGLTTQELDRVMHYKSYAGGAFSNPVWQSLHHLTNHSTYHRGQVTTLLRQLGVKAVSTDMIMFYREMSSHAAA